MKKLKNNIDTLEMKKLYEEGLTMKEIGKKYGVIKQTVQNRLGKIGVGRRPPKYTLVDKERLEKLYSEDISVETIAERLNESSWTVERALLYHGIPKRSAIKTGRKYANLFDNLAIGETKQVKSDGENMRQALIGTARAIGIRIATRSLGEERIMIIRIG